MLLDISISNFLSIAETQTLSLVANKKDHLIESNTIDTGIKTIPKLLKSSVIYGPNASGKSNILKGIDFMTNYILKGSHKMQEGDTIRTRPFKFSTLLTSEPSEFEVTLLIDGIRYQYGFSATSELVTGEWLFVFPHGKPQRWFERSFDAETNETEWYFGSKLTGHKSLWKDSTRKNALFLSTAVHLNSTQVKPLFEWFKKIVVVTADKSLDNEYSRSLCDDDDMCDNIKAFVAFADRGIHKIIVEEEKPVKINFPDDVPENERSFITKYMQNKTNQRISFLHTPSKKEGDSCEAYIDFDDESSGTQMLFAWAAPWLDILTSGRIAFIDELENSLHTQILIFLIKIINSSGNIANGQLIFTTHDTAVLQKKDLMRQDQIWFVEKDSKLQSNLYPLSDFKPRNEEAIQKGYLQGRYGAIPYTDDIDLNIKVNIPDED